MIKNIEDITSNINNNDLEEFLSNIKPNLIVNKNIKETKVDNSWINTLEGVLPNIDTIVRNPRRFIVQEEDVVVVEKTKKITQETIKHLAEHCENIQDIDDNGEVVPKKLLNVHKEDTTDLYENRFIYTLVKRLEKFMTLQLDKMNLSSTKEIKNQVEYRATANIENRNVNIKLTINDENIINIDEFKEGKKIKDRIMSCFEIISGFGKTEMIKELAGCTEVKSPIRKTNLILKEPNFQKAFILWEYLDKFEFKDPKTVDYKIIRDSSKETEEEFNLSFFIAANALDDKTDNIMNDNNIYQKIEKIINEYIYENDNDINVLNDTINNMYKKAINDKLERQKQIESIFEKYFEKNNNKLNLLKEIV